MTRYSKNAKLNAVLNEIETQLLEMGDSESESMDVISDYMWHFPHLSDYNIAQYGNLIVYFADVYEMYRKAGYKTTDAYSTKRIWETYKRQVGYVARDLMKRNNRIPSKWNCTK